MKVYHYFVSYVVCSTSKYFFFGMSEITRSKKITSFEDISSFRQSIAEKCPDIKADDIIIIGMPSLIQDEPY